MKTLYLLVVSLILILAACVGSAGNTNVPSPTEDERLAPLKKHAASQLGIKQSEIVFVSMIAEEWPDACLGLPEEGEMCAMVVTPGYLVVFNSPQGRVDFHTNADLSYFRMAPVGSLTTLLTWQRSGGIAGVCEQLEIMSDNSFSLSDCSGTILAQGALPEANAAEFTNYIDQYVVVNWFSTQPAGSADMFNDHFILYGKGGEKASDSQLLEINEWIAGLTGRLK